MSSAAFSGNYTHNIDPKGRVTIPAAYREALGEGFTIGLNNDFSAIALYPVEKWQEAGITPQMVLDKITYCRYGQGMHLDTLVYEALQTKLADYEAFLAQ